MDLLQRSDDQQLQPEAAEQLKRATWWTSSEPRPNASSITANWKFRDLAAPQSSLNWYAREAARIVQASFSFWPPDLPAESA